MWWTSGYAPVAIEVRQTGVSEGKTLVPRMSVPDSTRKRRAGSRPFARPRSSAAGVSPSMTARTSFFPLVETSSLVLGKHSEAGVAGAGPPSQARARNGNRDRSDVTERG